MTLKSFDETNKILVKTTSAELKKKVIPNVEAGGRLNRWFSAPPKIKNFIITYIWAGA